MDNVANNGLDQENDMIHVLCQRALNAARNFLRDQSGSIIIYTGAFMAIGMGGAALSIDIGRIVLLKTQMQNRADAGALAGAAQLDAQPGAIERATYIVEDSMQAYTTAINAGGAELATFAREFYAPAEDYVSRGLPTTVDKEARFTEVVLQRVVLSFFYAPALNVMTGQNASSYTELDARAVAMSDPFICKTQPMMICNPLEDQDLTTEDPLPDDGWAGFSIALKQGNTEPGAPTWTPGNFGLLELPTDALYDASGAGAVAESLSAVDPSGCYGYRVVTAPGSMTVKVSDAINERFGDVPSGGGKAASEIRPAPNISEYPLDTVVTNGTSPILGDGLWPRDTYWAAAHSGVTRPADLAVATRYQTYLYELEQIYWTKNGGKATAATEFETQGGGWTATDPSIEPVGLPLNGDPPAGMTIAENGHERRILRVNIMNCFANEVAGKGDYVSGGNYLEIFLTQRADDPAGGAGIYGEFVRKLNPRVSLEFHGNVRLTE